MTRTSRARRPELAKLAADRKQAENDLADRRKAVAMQQAEASRLESAATQAHDAATREETRRAELASKRSVEEAELAKLAAAKNRLAQAEAEGRAKGSLAQPEAEGRAKGSLAQPEAEGRAKGSLAQAEAEGRAKGSLAKPEAEVCAKGSLAQAEAEGRAKGSLAQPEAEGRAKGSLAQPEAEGRAKGSLAQPEAEGRAKGSLAQPEAEGRAKGSLAQPEAEGRAKGSLAQPEAEGRAKGSLAQPEAEGRAKGSLAQPEAEGRAKGSLAQPEAEGRAKSEAQRVKTQVRVAEADKPVTKADAKPTKLAKVSAIGFKGDESRGQVDITVDSDAKIELGEVTATHVELIVDNAELATKLERTLDVSKFGSPVHSVSSFADRRSPNRVRLVAELSQPVTADGRSRWHERALAVRCGSAGQTADDQQPVTGCRWLRCCLDPGRPAIGHAGAAVDGRTPADLSRRDDRSRFQGRAAARPAARTLGYRSHQHRRAGSDRREGHGSAQARAVGRSARGDPPVARPVVPPRGQHLSHRYAEAARCRGHGRSSAP